jgi:type I restriction enzyme, R subunit
VGKGIRVAPGVVGPNEADTCRDFVIPKLEAAGWEDRFVEQFPITDGRIIPTRSGHRREAERLRADYLLEHRAGVPVAVVEAKRLYRRSADGLQQAKRYAERLDIPFAYSTNGQEIVEHDYDTGLDRMLAEFPTPDELWGRYRAWKGIADDAVAVDLVLPFNRTLRNADGTVKEPRYYQTVAINRIIQAIRSGDRRVLVTMATGTGKTFVSLQVVWKLWSSAWVEGRKPRILYLADRNVLVDQPISREFKPVFGDAVWKVQGTARTSREIYFALYQALSGSGDDLGLFHDYPSDFFDLIVVDECHRGSARDESSWRAILNHFSSAAQLGMTATPLRDDNVDTYRYFGDPIFEYSLAQGIEDGFLAPYRVRRVVLSPDALGWAPEQGQLDRYGREIPEGLYTSRQFERIVSLLSRTEAAARHLTDYLQRSDPYGKTVVFCVDSEHAEQMRMALNNANADLARQHPDYVVRIVSDEGDLGRMHLGNFIDTESRTPVIATTSKLLSTGVDAPTVRNVVLFKPIGSMVEFKQIIGRGTRLYPDEDKLSFEIIDYSGATSLFEDPDFDGPPESVAVDEVDDEGTVVEPPVLEQPEPLFGDEETEDDAVAERAHRKFYVDEGDAFVTAEGFYLPDLEAGRLRLVEYRAYVADSVRALFPSPQDARGRWSTPEGRSEVRDALARRGIDLQEAADRLQLPDVDPVDLLVYVAWNEPVTSRRDRARRARQAPFLHDLVLAARQVLEELLDKYAEHGIEQLEDLSVLRIPPISDHGTVFEIADLFGGQDALRQAVHALQSELYAA